MTANSVKSLPKSISNNTGKKNIKYQRLLQGLRYNDLSNVVHSEEKIAPVNGLEINYDTFGSQEHPAIILIMGLGAQMILWREEFCESLAKAGYYVVRFDNRDVGLSSKLDTEGVPDLAKIIKDLAEGKKVEAPYLLSDMAKDTIGLLDYLHINSAHIVGISLGGMIAQTITIDYPERIRSLTSMSSTPGIPVLPQAFLKPISPDKEKNIEDSVQAWKIINGTTYKFDEEYVRKREARAFDRSFYPVGVARQYAAIAASGTRYEQLRNLKTKTLVMHGDADILIPVQGGKDTAKEIPGAKLVIIKGMGHNMPEEVTPQIISDILDNVKEN